MSRLRKALRSDSKVLWEIEQACFSEADSPLSRRQIHYHIKKNPLWVVEEEKKILGYILWFVFPKGLRIYSIAVLPQARGKGIASKLMEHCFTEAQTCSKEYIRLEVRQDNVVAVTLYEKLGFRKEKILPAYYPDGGDGFRMMRTSTCTDPS